MKTILSVPNPSPEAAQALCKLRNANAPVLWRPFHEFDGQWFWWGKGGADCFVKL